MILGAVWMREANEVADMAVLRLEKLEEKAGIEINRKE